MYESINYFEKKFDRKSRDKLMDELKKLVSEIGIKDSEESFSLLFFILYDIYFLPDLTGIIFSYEKPDDKKWPPIKSGQIDITITKRMNWSEFEKIVKRRWKTIESIMQQKRFPSFSYPKIGFHDVDLLIEIYKMRRRGLKYKEITDKLEAKSFPVPEETLRQKIRAVNKFFVKNN